MNLPSEKHDGIGLGCARFDDRQRPAIMASKARVGGITLPREDAAFGRGQYSSCPLDRRTIRVKALNRAPRCSYVGPSKTRVAKVADGNEPRLVLCSKSGRCIPIACNASPALPSSNNMLIVMAGTPNPL
jgi:hypothetical protein